MPTDALDPILRQIRDLQERGAWESAAHLFAEHAVTLIDRQPVATVAALYAPFPSHVVERLPTLWYLAGLVNAARNRAAEAMHWLTSAIEYYTRHQEHPERQAWIHLELARIEYRRDNFAEVQVHVDCAMQLASQIGTQSPALHAFLYYMIANLCADTGRVAEGVGYARTAAEEFRQQGSTLGEFRALLSMGSLARQMGDFRTEREAVVQARACYQSGHLEPYSFEALLGAETHLAWYRGDLDGALEQAQMWLALTQGGGYSRRRLYATLVLGNVLRALGRYDQALQAYQNARRIADEHNANFVRWIDAQESWVAALQGRLDEAAELAARALTPADHGQRMSFQVNLAVVDLLRNRWATAEGPLQESLAFYRRSNDQVATCAISFALAYAQIASKAQFSTILQTLQADLRWLAGCDNAYFPLWWHPLLVSRVALWLLTTTDYRPLGRRLFLQGKLGGDGLRTLQQAAYAGGGALSLEATDLLTILGQPPLHHLDGVEDVSVRTVIADAVAQGQLAASALPELLRQLRTAQEQERDNPTAVAIFLLHVQGVTSQEIGAKLACSRSTVSHTLQSIYESLGVARAAGTTRTEQRAALRRAAQARGLLV